MYEGCRHALLRLGCTCQGFYAYVVSLSSTTCVQVRRSSFKYAMNANGVCGFGADLGGVQQYTLNGNKII